MPATSPGRRSGWDEQRLFGGSRYRRYVTIGLGSAGVILLADAAHGGPRPG